MTRVADDRPAARHEALGELLRHPRVWLARGTSAPASSTLPSGFAVLDARLPGGGWPASTLIELLVDRPGIGELSCVMPVLAQCGSMDPDAWLAWIAPPHEPYAPGLVAQGVDPDRVLVVHTTQALWAIEQTLRSRACAAVLGWIDDASVQDLRRIKLATEQSGAMTFLFRPARHRVQSSPAELRLVLTSRPAGLEIDLLKSRGGRPGEVLLPWGRPDRLSGSAEQIG